MSHPALWPKTPFYPIGNTSAVCLTQDLPPEEPANILLLGCGDPRNILYTIHAGSNQASGESRQLDFTCCDNEPGVLARNVILLTLVVDGSSLDTIWNIFFHFKLDVDSMSLLISQSKRLIEISRDLETWNSLPYSGFIRMCNRDTLARLRQYWTLYVNFNDLPNSKIEFILRQFSLVNDTESLIINFSSARSAGPYFTRALGPVSTHFSHYWRTGTVFRDHKIVAATIKLNPTFVYSAMGEGCSVYSGTHPLQCFHLGEAFASSHEGEVQECDLVNVAVSQFHRWCTSFKSAISTGAVRIRFFAGDAIAFCHALHHIRITSSTESGLYTLAWSGSLLTLDSDDYTTRSAPTTFNVVETSNMIDHIGLLNLLIATTPLLRHSPSATLYTEALLPHGEKADIGFLARFCTELPAMALLLGICPAGCVSNFCSESNTHEILMQRSLKSQQYRSQQYHERFAWKIPYLGNRDVFALLKDRDLHPSFEPPTLARLLSEIYYNMFKDIEDPTQMKRVISSILRSKGEGTAIVVDSVIHYDRATFASFLGLVKSRVHVDWIATMELLDDLLSNDKRLLLGSNFYQELCCQLHTRGIYTMDTLRTDIDSQTTRIDRTGIFDEWDIVPPVVCVVLLVPRSKLKPLEDKEIEQLGSPMFRGEIRNRPLYHNIFTSVQITFGSVRTEGSGSDAIVIINEDSSGLGGKSPLVMSFWVPAFNLVKLKPSSVEVALGVQSTPAASMPLAKDFGPELQVFSANVMDKNYVHIVRTRPHHPKELEILRAVAPEPPLPDTRSVSITRTSGGSVVMTARWNLTPGPGCEALSKRTTEVKSKPIAPCAITITIGNAAENIMVFPFPVIGEKIKLRVARTSGYVEAEGLARWPLVGMGPDSDFVVRAPTIFLGERNDPLLWNIHRVDLRHLPVMQKLDEKENSGLANPQVSLSFSDRELALRKSDTKSDVLVNVKGTIHALFNLAFQPNARPVFGLNDPSDGIYTIIVLNDIRLDASSHTLVADGCVLPLTEALVDRHLQEIGSLTAYGQMVRITTRGSEVTAWKYLLPAFTERCRSGWSHKKTCEYIISGVPRGTSCTDNPICSCGEGKNLGKLGEKKEWSGLSKFMTRIAISPLFAISYLTSVAGEDRMSGHEAKPGRVKELQHPSSALPYMYARNSKRKSEEYEDGDIRRQKLRTVSEPIATKENFTQEDLKDEEYPKIFTIDSRLAAPHNGDEIIPDSDPSSYELMRTTLASDVDAEGNEEAYSESNQSSALNAISDSGEIVPDSDSFAPELLDAPSTITLALSLTNACPAILPSLDSCAALVPEDPKYATEESYRMDSEAVGTIFTTHELEADVALDGSSDSFKGTEMDANVGFMVSSLSILQPASALDSCQITATNPTHSESPAEVPVLALTVRTDPSSLLADPSRVNLTSNRKINLETNTASVVTTKLDPVAPVHAVHHSLSPISTTTTKGSGISKHSPTQPSSTLVKNLSKHERLPERSPRKMLALTRARALTAKCMLTTVQLQLEHAIESDEYSDVASVATAALEVFSLLM